MTKQMLGQMLNQGSSSDESGDDSPDDVNLEELAELVYKKLREEIGIESERIGRTMTGR